jgi:hypothetical protein
MLERSPRAAAAARSEKPGGRLPRQGGEASLDWESAGLRCRSRSSKT